MSPQTIIVGGGIIGLCTAYYQAKSLAGDGSNITIVDNAPELLLGASGAANGCCGYQVQGEPADRVEYQLDILGCTLHKELSNKHDGFRRWCYRPETTIKVMYPEKRHTLSEEESSYLVPLPEWISTRDQYIGVRLEAEYLIVHMHPKLFCDFLIEECKAMGVRISLNTEVTKVIMEDGSIVAVHLENSEVHEKWSQPCQKLLLSAGPWTPRIISKLFPETKLLIELDPIEPPRTWLNVQDPDWTSERVSHDTTQALFEDVCDKPLNMTNYSNGSIYVGGRPVDFFGPQYAQRLREKPEKLPLRIVDIALDEKVLEEYHRLAAQFTLPQQPPEDLRILRKGKAYLSTLSIKRSITVEVDPALLWRREEHNHQLRTSGVFISLGQSSGIRHGPACGKILSEMILGKELSMDMTTLGIPEEYIQ